MNDQNIQHAINLKDNPDWKWAKAQLEALITAYGSIGTLDYKLSDTALAKELRRRKGVVALIRSWIDELDATGELPISPPEEDTLIMRFDQSS